MIHLAGISKTYGEGAGQCAALKGIDLRLDAGQALAVLGPSGSGKTTLLEIIGTLARPSGGRYTLNGTCVNELNDSALSALRNSVFGFVFQGFNLIPDMYLYENTALPLRYGPAGSRRGAEQAVSDALASVGLLDKIKNKCRELSGGEQQRAAIARAIIRKPKIILADEPTGNLDSANGAAVLELLTGLWKKGSTVVVITHSPEVAAKFPRIININDGKITYDGPPLNLSRGI